MEKAPKKLRPFLDGTQKHKTRLAALLAFLESSSEAEQARIYKEYADLLVTFVVETFNVTLERLSVEREFQSKFERGLAKDLEEYFRVPFLFDKVLRYLRTDLPTMAQTEQLVNIVRTLLHPGNHPSLRREGIRLLLDWLRDEATIVPETLHLFASCVSLQTFLNDGSHVFLGQPAFPLATKMEPPLFAAPMGTLVAEQELMLLREIFHFLTFDPDADRKSTALLYRLLRHYYLEKLYPEVATRIAVMRERRRQRKSGESQTSAQDDGNNVDIDLYDGEEEGEINEEQEEETGLHERQQGGFLAGCPPALQAVVVKYFAMWTVQSPELFAQAGVSAGSTMPVAAFILQEILLASAEDLELVHEIIRQSLLLPFAYKSVIRISIGVLRTWVFTSKERRPSFLQNGPLPFRIVEERGGDIAGASSGSITGGGGPITTSHEEVLDQYLQRYIGYLAAIFDGRPSAGYPTEQLELYRETIFFLRGLSMKAFFIPSRETWDCLLEMVLSIMQSHLTSHNKFLLIANPEGAEDFSQLVGETLFGLWIRSETTVASQWDHLMSVLSECTRWPLLVAEWARTLHDLTDVLVETLFAPQLVSIGASGMNEENLNINTAGGDQATRRRNMRSGTFEGNNLAAILSMSSPISRAMLAELQASMNRPFTNDRRNDTFLTWTALPWTRENVIFLWRNMIRALGDLNAIERPDIHEAAILCLVQILERMLAIRDLQPYFCRPLPPIFDYSVALLDACDLPAKLYERSRCLAYSAICRMFCRRHDISFPDHYYTRFYLALVNGLADKDDPVSAVILLNASHMFGRQLPGAPILIPAFLKCIAGMLNTQLGLEKSGTLVPMMRIVANLAILPDVLDRMSVPRIEAPLPIMSAIPITCAGEVELDGIKMQVKDFLSMMDFQEYVRNDPPTHSVLLTAIGVLLVNELLAQEQPSETLIDGYLNMLLDHLLPKDSAVLPIIFDLFYGLAQMLPLFGKFGQEREVLVIQRLVTAIRSAFADVDVPFMEQDVLISRLIFTLLEWLLVLPHDWLVRQHSLREQFFAVLEECLRRTLPVVSGGGAVGATAGGIGAFLLGKSQSSAAIAASSHTGGGAIRKSYEQLPLGGLVSKDDSHAKKGTSGGAIAASEQQREEGEVDEVCLSREAAEFALVHFLHHLRNFAPEFGPTLISSQVPEPILEGGGGSAHIDRALYFALDDASILTVQQLPPQNDASLVTHPQVRLIIRNAAGRFCWDAHSFYETFDHRNSPLLFPPEEPHRWAAVGRLSNLTLAAGMREVAHPEPYIPPKSLSMATGQLQRIARQLPRWKDDVIDLERTDMLKELLEYITEEHPECIPPGNGRICEPATIPPSRQELIHKVEKHCMQHLEEEGRIANAYAEMGKGESARLLASTHEFNAQHQGAISSQSSSITRPPLVPYQFCRQFLASFGFLTPLEGISSSLTSSVTGTASTESVTGGEGGSSGMAIKVLPKTSGMLRDLRGLDKKHAREVIKMAILYVAPGQEDETSILSNGPDHNSSHYDEFVRSLGWEIDLKEHFAYAGGLEAGMTVDDRALYYCSSTVEVVFHEAVSILVDELDTKLIKKKRHIGNDHVHIVWNEHYRDYRPSTIRGDFGNAQIVITPLPSSHLYRISLFRDAAVPLFGPLFDGALVPRALLGPLVRATAICANRAVVSALHRAATAFRHPFHHRARDLSMIVRRHAQHRWSLDQFLAYVLFANAPLPEEMAQMAMGAKEPAINAKETTAGVKEAANSLSVDSMVERLVLDPSITDERMAEGDVAVIRVEGGGGAGEGDI